MTATVLARCFSGLLVGLAVVAACIAPGADGAVPGDRRLDFKVLRNGKEIGRHVLRFESRGEELVVEISIELQVTLIGFLPVYSYEHHNREVWRAGRLLDMQTRTNDNGTEHQVRATAGAEGLVVEADGRREVVALDMLSTSYWNEATVAQRRLLNTQTGSPMSVSIAETGRETVATAGGSIEARRYVISGDLELEVWYDDRGTWVKTRFSVWDGSTVEYVLQ